MNLNKYAIILFLIILIFLTQACKKKTTKLYYPSGEIESIIVPVNKNLNDTKLFYKNGKIKAQGTMNKDGYWVGHWKEYYSDGVLKWEGEFEKGCPILLVDSKWPDFNKIKWSIEIQGISDTLIINKTYNVRIIAPDIYPDMLLFTYKDYSEVELNKDTKTLDLYPYTIKAEEPGELILLLTLPNEQGNYIKYKSTAVIQLYAKINK